MLKPFIPRKLNLLLLLTFIAPTLIIFRSFLTKTSLSVGDAPYFFQSFQWFLSEPHAWTTRGVSLGGINQFIWIWPYMAFISFFEKMFSINSALLVRIFFYFPAITLAPLGAYKLARSFSVTPAAAYFAALLSLFNTYFLIVVDGGQVGIMLAYAIFPFVLTFILSYVNKTVSKASYTKAFITLSVLTIADPRVALICLATGLLLSHKKIKRILVLCIPWLLINQYWIYPLINFGERGQLSALEIQTTSFLNGLFLYAPHWYQNIYGVVTYPTLLFSTFFLLIISNFFIRNKDNKRLLFVFLLFVFLIKGSTSPFGQFFTFLQRIPFGSAFRDSTKFFIPLIYVAGILISFSIDSIRTTFRSRYLLCILYALFLIPFYPAFLGNMNFVLSGHETNPSVIEINQHIQSGEMIDRTAWFPERDPKSIETINHEIVDAKSLVDLRFFAQLNTGTQDRFNFLNQHEADWWFDLLNIQNLAFIKNPREIVATKTEQEDYERLSKLLPSLNYLKNQNNESSLYKNEGGLPSIYGVQKAFVVIGSDNVYAKLLKSNNHFAPYNHAFLFTDDGKWNPDSLSEYASTSAVLINNTNDPNALTMSLLQSSFRSSQEAHSNQFAKYDTQQYLTYKYELLIRKFLFDDFDFSKGISFSTKEGEQIQYKISLDKNDDYMIAIRTMGEAESAGMDLLVDGERLVTTKNSPQFEWTLAKKYLKQGTHTILLENKGGLQIFNILAVNPYTLFTATQAKASGLSDHFQTYSPQNVPASLLNQVWQPVLFETAGTSKYLLTPSDDTNWVVWTNNYNNKWQLSRDFLGYPSLPGYSSVNVFYRRPGWSQMTLEFQGQESVRFGIYISLVSIIAMIMIFLWI